MRSKYVTLSNFAIINVCILGFFGFLNVFLFNNNVGFFDKISVGIILASVIGSIISKYKSPTYPTFFSSVSFDLVLIFYLYNPLELQAKHTLRNSFFEFENILILFLFYLYLVIYHYIILRVLKKKKKSKHKRRSHSSSSGSHHSSSHRSSHSSTHEV